MHPSIHYALQDSKMMALGSRLKLPSSSEQDIRYAYKFDKGLGFRQSKGSFAHGQNNSEYCDWAPLMKSLFGVGWALSELKSREHTQ